jgi:hypothetical protein
MSLTCISPWIGRKMGKAINRVLSAPLPHAAVCFGYFCLCVLGVSLLFLRSQPACGFGSNFMGLFVGKVLDLSYSLENECYCQRDLSVHLVKFVFLLNNCFTKPDFSGLESWGVMSLTFKL